jgi:hypothetical protein
MNSWHDDHPASDDATRQLLRYRLAIIAIFLLAVLSAGLVNRVWQGGIAHRGDEVESTR